MVVLINCKQCFADSSRVLDVKEKIHSLVVLLLDVRSKQDVVSAVMGHLTSVSSASRTSMEEEILFLLH